jgi:flagellar hook assembly protein FlgD
MTWDGTDDSGALLADGMYVYRIMISTEKGYRSSAYQKLVIVR